MGGNDLGNLDGHLLGVVGPIAKNHQVRHAGALHGSFIGALQCLHLPAQLRFDLAQGNGNALFGYDRCHHRFLQARPSGSMMRSASIGPQVPH